MIHEANGPAPVKRSCAVWEASPGGWVLTGPSSTRGRRRRMTVPPGVECQDEAGRLWDVLWLLRCAIGRSDGGPGVRFGVHVRNDNSEGTPPLVRLKALCGPGDRGEPVITVMLPDKKSPTNRADRGAARCTA